jgi:hypothetical protein
MGWTVGIRFPAWAEIFLFATFRPAVGPGSVGIGYSLPGDKQPEREADRSLLSRAEVKNAIPLLPPYVSHPPRMHFETALVSWIFKLVFAHSEATLLSLLSLPFMYTFLISTC